MKKIITICLLAIFFFTGCASKNIQQTKILDKQANKTSAQQLVGNDRDEHECIVSAGYSWCELKKKCLRSWEEKCESDGTPGNRIATTTKGQETITKPIDKISDWKTYKNNEGKFEFKYPKTFKLASIDDYGYFISFNPQITSSIYVMKAGLKEMIFSVYVKKNETLTPEYIAKQSDPLKPATLRPMPTPIIIDGVSGYKVAKGTISVNNNFPQGTAYISDNYFLQKDGGPILNLVVPDDLGNQILETFKFSN